MVGRKEIGRSSRPSKVDAKGETKKEEEKRRADNLHCLLPLLHLDVLQDDEAEQNASDTASDVSDDAGARPSRCTGVSVPLVGGVPKVQGKEGEHPRHLQNPRQLSPTRVRRFVAPEPCGGDKK